MGQSSSTRPVALVTGAGRRLGKYIAQGLIENGYDLLVHFHASEEGALSLVELAQRSGGNASIIKADLSTVAGVTSLAEKAFERFRRIDLLVNNAGVFLNGSALDASEEVWDITINVNLRAMFFLCQRIGRQMLSNGGGRIINIASLGGIQPWVEHAPYSISKAGVIMLTRIFAKALAPYVLVNAIAPGLILMEDEITKMQHIPEERIPLKRYGTYKDIVEAVLFLATRASYTTGQVLIVDGGRFLSAYGGDVG